MQKSKMCIRDRCYGWFYSIQKEPDSVGIQITYCNIETEEIRRFKEVRSFEELKSWFEGLIHEYVKWARYLYHHGIRRQMCIRDRITAALKLCWREMRYLILHTGKRMGAG